MEIKIEDYISQDEIKEIVIERVKSHVDSNVENTIKCAIQYAFYDILGRDYLDKLPAIINKKIENISVTDIIGYADGVSFRNSEARNILNQSLNDNKEKLQEIILGDEPLQVLKEGRTELGKQSRKEIREQTGKDSTYRSKDHKAYFGREGVKANCLTTGLGMEGTVVEDFQIRKLTPTECLRLQSMPDDYFDKAIYKNKLISNTQRYKMCGNAFNKEVVKHIIKQVIK